MRQKFLLYAAFCLLTAAGCGDKTKDNDEGGGGGAKPSEWIVGAWDVTADDAPADMKMHWHINADGKIDMDMTRGEESKQESASWKLVSEDKKSLVMELTIEGKPDVKKVTATFKDADNATLEAEGESTKVSIKRAH